MNEENTNKKKGSGCLLAIWILFALATLGSITGSGYSEGFTLMVSIIAIIALFAGCMLLDNL
jgi:hypothetical protein